MLRLNIIDLAHKTIKLWLWLLLTIKLLIWLLIAIDFLASSNMIFSNLRSSVLNRVITFNFLAFTEIKFCLNIF